MHAESFSCRRSSTLCGTLEPVGSPVWFRSPLLCVDARALSNHYYLLLRMKTESGLSAGMQWLGVSYTVWFNRRHRRSGHLFEGRFKAILVEFDAWGAELSRYLHPNPVRTGSMDWRRRGLPSGRGWASGRRRSCPCRSALGKTDSRRRAPSRSSRKRSPQCHMMI